MARNKKGKDQPAAEQARPSPKQGREQVFDRWEDEDSWKTSKEEGQQRESPR